MAITGFRLLFHQTLPWRFKYSLFIFQGEKNKTKKISNDSETDCNMLLEREWFVELIELIFIFK